MAALVLALAGMAALAGPASAGTPASVRRLLPSVAPLPAATGYPPSALVELRFRPVPVAVGDVEYHLRLDVIQFRDRYFGRDTMVFADLYRLDGSLAQAHSYSFEASDGVALTLDRQTLATAALNTGGAFAPTVLEGRFTASEPAVSHGCTLTNGNPGVRLHATGNVAWTQFAVDTGTTPFFGVLADGPAAATLIYDPGCRGGSGGGRAHGVAACPGKLALSGQSRSGDLGFAIATGYTGARSTLAAISTSGDYEVERFHLGWQRRLPGSDLDVVRHGPGGAVARFGSAGSTLMRGSATFRSLRAPRHSRWHRCRAGGRIHRFHWLRYSGRLRPDADPLTAMFDTGYLTLAEPLRARLVIVQYARG
jgi:hypothetical protein